MKVSLIGRVGIPALRALLFSTSRFLRVEKFFDRTCQFFRCDLGYPDMLAVVEFGKTMNGFGEVRHEMIKIDCLGLKVQMDEFKMTGFAVGFAIDPAEQAILIEDG